MPCYTWSGTAVSVQKHLPFNYNMTNAGQPKKIGGEYGKVHANIDIDKLNTYLAKNVIAVNTPVDVKQFKVR